MTKNVKSRLTRSSPSKPIFVLVGSYSPRDAAKLLERLEKAGIAFRTRPSRPFPQPGPTMTLSISVDSARSSEVHQIQRELFRDDRTV